MNFETIFANAIDLAENTFVPVLPELNWDELDVILCSQLKTYEYIEPKMQTDDEISGLIVQLRQTRIRLGFTQTEIANSISSLCGRKVSQTTVCRFEGRILTKRNMTKLRPTFEQWIYLAKANPNTVRSASANQKSRSYGPY